jgi:hypothetical protein
MSNNVATKIAVAVKYVDKRRYAVKCHLELPLLLPVAFMFSNAILYHCSLHSHSTKKQYALKTPFVQMLLDRIKVIHKLSTAILKIGG